MLKAWRVNESEIFAAESLDQAVELSMRLTGNPRDEALDESFAGEADLSMQVWLDELDCFEGKRTIGELLASAKGPGLLFAFDI